MGYLSNYNTVRDQFRKYLTGHRSKKLLDLSREYSRQNAYNRVAAASELRTGFQQGFRGLQNTGMANSGEVERLRRRLGNQFVYANDQLNRNELAALGKNAERFKAATLRARLEAEKERKARERIKNSGQRGNANGGGAGRYYLRTK